jgi:hypothetical protein
MRHEEDGTSRSTAYETRDVKIRPLAVSLVGLIVALVASYLLVLGIFRLFSASKSAEDASADPVAVQRAALPPEQRLPAQPRIQADPAGEYDLLRRSEEQRLTTYGWIDRQAGVVRIPVDQAMKLVLDQGLPVRQTATPQGAIIQGGQAAPKK